MTTTAYASASQAVSPATVLAGLRVDRATADAAEARILAGAVAWAEAHPASGDVDAAAHWEHGIGVPLAGDGTPLVAEWCVAEFAAALGLSTDAVKSLLAHALELRHRLPRVWARVQTGDLQAWRARRIADHTVSLSVEAADYVDRHLAPVAHKIGPAQTQRLVDEAIARIDPDRVVETAEASADRRHVTIHDHQISFNGTMRVEADLDIADALALGDLARTQLGLNLTTGEPAQARQTREVVLHVHLTDTAIAGVCRTRPGATRVGRPVASVCGRFGIGCPRAASSGLAAARAIGAQPTAAIVRATRRRSARGQQRSGRPHQLHGTAPATPGAATSTTSCPTPAADLPPPTLAPLCRRHHRLKTHCESWNYTMVEPGTYLWRSPHGLAYQRDHTGTTPLE